MQETDRLRDRQEGTEIETSRQTERQTDSQRDKQTGTEIDRQTSRQADIETDRQTARPVAVQSRVTQCCLCWFLKVRQSCQTTGTAAVDLVPAH